mmetsp:Transcript_23507/g.52026  ORF Transcript_23507/g.52026 Transcript_23507/m.52026 type:complete len:309 (-) Transcript_23507:1640-2566(-)
MRPTMQRLLALHLLPAFLLRLPLFLLPRRRQPHQIPFLQLRLQRPMRLPSLWTHVLPEPATRGTREPPRGSGARSGMQPTRLPSKELPEIQAFLQARPPLRPASRRSRNSSRRHSWLSRLSRCCCRRRWRSKLNRLSRCCCKRSRRRGLSRSSGHSRSSRPYWSSRHSRRSRRRCCKHSLLNRPCCRSCSCSSSSNSSNSRRSSSTLVDSLAWQRLQEVRCLLSPEWEASSSSSSRSPLALEALASAVAMAHSLGPRGPSESGNTFGMIGDGVRARRPFYVSRRCSCRRTFKSWPGKCWARPRATQPG